MNRVSILDSWFFFIYSEDLNDGLLTIDVPSFLVIKLRTYRLMLLRYMSAILIWPRLFWIEATRSISFFIKYNSWVLKWLSWTYTIVFSSISDSGSSDKVQLLLLGFECRLWDEHSSLISCNLWPSAFSLRSSGPAKLLSVFRLAAMLRWFCSSLGTV